MAAARRSSSPTTFPKLLRSGKRSAWALPFGGRQALARNTMKASEAVRRTPFFHRLRGIHLRVVQPFEVRPDPEPGRALCASRPGEHRGGGAKLRAVHAAQFPHLHHGGAWPRFLPNAAFTYLLVPAQNADPEKARLLKGLLEWAVHVGPASIGGAWIRQPAPGNRGARAGRDRLDPLESPKHTNLRQNISSDARFRRTIMGLPPNCNRPRTKLV